MSRLIKWLAEFIGTVLAKILPAVFDELRKPKQTKVIGDNEELKKTACDSAADQLLNSRVCKKD